MARKNRPAKGPKQVETLTHEEATRKNLATAEMASIAERLEELDPAKPVRFARSTPLPKGATRERDPDLDPQIIWDGARIRLSPDQVRQLQAKGEVEIGDAQLVWRGKDRQDWSDLVVQPPQLYIQEKVHPKAIIDDLIRRSHQKADEKDDAPDLFWDFNGLNDPEARLEFYQHDQHWSNRMILGDGLLVMGSLAEREHLRGQVQCIYFDPPYGIKFNSNWQVSTLSRDVKDGKREDVSREPEQVKAFRDTWKDGIHSYLTYLRDRLSVARELLANSGSIFVQISDENVHRVHALMDEVFGSENFISLIAFYTSGGRSAAQLPTTANYLIWYGRSAEEIKFRRLFRDKEQGGLGSGEFSWVTFADGSSRRLTRPEHEGQVEFPRGGRLCIPSDLTSSHEYIRDSMPLMAAISHRETVIGQPQ
jgi:adenine-specific DNA-methyltransferase